MNWKEIKILEGGRLLSLNKVPQQAIQFELFINILGTNGEFFLLFFIYYKFNSFGFLNNLVHENLGCSEILNTRYLFW